ncbi:MAG: hydroxyacid dehydrogenase [Enterocloster clostridioformis]|nr:hydroxyacid dehydrogenase [Enterocloster clostridioformis]
MLNASVLDRYPKVDIAAVQALLEEKCREDRHKIIVLDDDPTGVQTVHDISVYTDWSYDSIKRGFEEKGKLFYILTNSRGFTVEHTTRAHLEIGETAAKVSEETGIDYVIVSRGDSTLRGHYPLETELLARAEEKHRNRAVDGEIICPYFKEGGRFTIGNVHYVKYGNELVPAGETEFAQDKTFGYHCSNLKDYVEEKTGGRYPAREVLDISLEELRSLDYSAITDKLLALHDFGKIVVNAVDACDLKVFCIALYDAMKQGRRFMFRTAAGFVKEFGAVSDRPLLSREEMVAGDRKTGGIIVVGSHTKKTTSQLEELKAVPGIRFLEFNSDLVLDEEKFQEEIQSVVRREEELLEQGVTVAVYTKRKLLSLENDSPEAALTRSVKISDAVQSLVGGLKVTPGFVVAKGGITSSDVGTKALKVKKATVLGQVRPGIPVWRTGAERRFPGIPYVIFPGNVGEAETLKETVEILMGSKG